MGNTRKYYKILRLALLFCFVILCAFAFYFNLNKISAAVIAGVLILYYIKTTEYPDSYYSKKEKVKRGMVYLFTAGLLFLLFQVFDPGYFTSKVDNFLYIVLAYSPVEFYYSVKSLRSDGVFSRGAE